MSVSCTWIHGLPTAQGRLRSTAFNQEDNVRFPAVSGNFSISPVGHAAGCPPTAATVEF